MRYDKLTGKISKDAKTYGLDKVKSGKHVLLFDFSRIESIALDDEYKQRIKETIIGDCSIINDFTYICIGDNFDKVAGCVYVKNAHVYNKEGKRVYTIIDVSAINLSILKRQSVYEEYETMEVIKEKYYQDNSSYDIELVD